MKQGCGKKHKKRESTAGLDLEDKDKSLELPKEWHYEADHTELCNILLQCHDNKPIKCHKVLLCSWSPVWREAIVSDSELSGLKEDNKLSLPILKVNAPAKVIHPILVLCNGFYQNPNFNTTILPLLSTTILRGMLEFSHGYDLIKQISNYLLTSLTPKQNHSIDDVINTWILSQQVKANVLSSACKIWLSENRHELITKLRSSMDGITLALFNVYVDETETYMQNLHQRSKGLRSRLRHL